MNIYYTLKGGNTAGPYTEEAIAHLAESKQLGRDDWLSTAGQPWKRAHEILPALFPEEKPHEVTRALSQAAEHLGYGGKAVGKVGAKVAGVAAKLGVDHHVVRGLDKLSASARAALRGTAERNPRLAGELAAQFDANKKNLVWSFGYAVFQLLTIVAVLVLFDLLLAVRGHHSFSFFLSELLGPSGVALLMLIGVVVAAVRCLVWIFRDEFRAVAVGRKVFLIWIVISATFTFFKHIPRSTVTAPAAAVVAHEQRVLPAPGAKDPGARREVLVVDAKSAKIEEVTWKDWVKGPLMETGKDIWANYIILALLNAIYHQLRGLRPHFGWAHFINVVTFGLYFRFTRYDFDDVSDDTPAEPEGAPAQAEPAQA